LNPVPKTLWNDVTVGTSKNGLQQLSAKKTQKHPTESRLMAEIE